MKYKVGDKVTLKENFKLTTGEIIKKDSEGKIVEVKDLLLQYKVDFDDHKGVWLGDDDLN